MTEQQFISGRLFEYSGHFQRMHNEALNYEGGEIIDSAGDAFATLHAMYDEYFIIFKPFFGRIRVYFNECQLIN